MEFRVLGEALGTMHSFALNLENLISDNQRFCAIAPFNNFGVALDRLLVFLSLGAQANNVFHLVDLGVCCLASSLFLVFGVAPSDKVGQCTLLSVKDAFLIFVVHVWFHFVATFIECLRLESD